MSIAINQPHFSSKKEKYQWITAQLPLLIGNETNAIANAANIAALLHETMQNLWTGFYFVDAIENQLILGPFQGPVACTRIDFGKGVCGSAWQMRKSILVPNVALFPGHIACSSLSKSELVSPIFNKSQEVCGLIDLDSEALNTYGDEEKALIENIAQIFAAKSDI